MLETAKIADMVRDHSILPWLSEANTITQLNAPMKQIKEAKKKSEKLEIKNTNQSQSCDASRADSS